MSKINRKPQTTCNCKAYNFPHRELGGKCQGRPQDYCEHGIHYSHDCDECHGNASFEDTQEEKWI